MGDSNGTAGWPPRRPRYTVVQVSDPHIPADGFLFDRVDACARVQASIEMIATRVDVLDDGEIVATFVPLTGRDEILYEVLVDESELRPAV